MTIQFSGKASVQGVIGLVASALVYLGIGFLGYAAWLDTPIAFDDPWLYGVVLAWPVLVLLVLLKWMLVAMVLCMAAIGVGVGWTEWQIRRETRPA